MKIFSLYAANLFALAFSVSEINSILQMLVSAKDMLEGMLIKLQDDTIDRLLLNKTLDYDDCKSGKCKCKNKCSNES